MLIRSFRNLFLALLAIIERRVVSRPFSDPLGRKGAWALLSRAPAHVLRHVHVSLQGVPRLTRPLRVLFLADLHTGSHTDDLGRLRDLIRFGAELEPDLMCLGGDYVNLMPFGGGRVPPTTTASILADVRPPLGSFAILGDHDETYGAGMITRALREAGITVLVNETVSVGFDADEVSITGVTPDAARLRDLIIPSQGNALRLVLAHDPAAFALLPQDAACLMLCGHTHGGQIRIPLLGPLMNLSDAPLRWTYGHIVDGKRHLYVTSGIGTSLVPLRIAVPPELALIEVDGAELVGGAL
jgi:uncharacterized protein